MKPAGIIWWDEIYVIKSNLKVQTNKSKSAYMITIAISYAVQKCCSFMHL